MTLGATEISAVRQDFFRMSGIVCGGSLPQSYKERT